MSKRRSTVLEEIDEDHDKNFDDVKSDVSSGSSKRRKVVRRRKAAISKTLAIKNVVPVSEQTTQENELSDSDIPVTSSSAQPRILGASAWPVLAERPASDPDFQPSGTTSTALLTHTYLMVYENVYKRDNTGGIRMFKITSMPTVHSSDVEEDSSHLLQTAYVEPSSMKDVLTFKYPCIIVGGTTDVKVLTHPVQRGGNQRELTMSVLLSSNDTVHTANVFERLGMYVLHTFSHLYPELGQVLNPQSEGWYGPVTVNADGRKILSVQIALPYTVSASRYLQPSEIAKFTSNAFWSSNQNADYKNRYTEIFRVVTDDSVVTWENKNRLYGVEWDLISKRVLRRGQYVLERCLFDVIGADSLVLIKTIPHRAWCRLGDTSSTDSMSNDNSSTRAGLKVFANAVVVMPSTQTVDLDLFGAGHAPY